MTTFEISDIPQLHTFYNLIIGTKKIGIYCKKIFRLLHINTFNGTRPALIRHRCTTISVCYKHNIVLRNWVCTALRSLISGLVDQWISGLVKFIYLSKLLYMQKRYIKYVMMSNSIMLTISERLLIKKTRTKKKETISEEVKVMMKDKMSIEYEFYDFVRQHFNSLYRTLPENVYNSWF